MKSEDAIARIVKMRQELDRLAPTWDSQEFVSWDERTKSILTHVLGVDHRITKHFADLHWASMVYGDAGADRKAFEDSRAAAAGLFEAAVAELELLADATPAADETGIDPELWQHVSPEIQAQAWGKAASQAVIFTEDRIRKWADRPPSEVGKDLAIAIFGGSGNYKMGLTPGEEQGWQFLAQGIAQALRNADAHRIQQRSDHRRYALGVVGTCSLLLTQMRHEHGNRFRDVSPAAGGAT